jgi:hypothetical protein
MSSKSSIKKAVDNLRSRVEMEQGEAAADKAVDRLILAVPFKEGEGPEKEDIVGFMERTGNFDEQEAKQALRESTPGILLKAGDIAEGYYMGEGDLALLYGQDGYQHLSEIGYWRPEEINFNGAFAIDDNGEGADITSAADQLASSTLYGDEGGGGGPYYAESRQTRWNPTDREKIDKIRLDRDMNAYGAASSIQRAKVSDLVRAASNPCSCGPSCGCTPCRKAHGNPMSKKQEAAELARFMRELREREGLRSGRKQSTRRNPSKTRAQLVSAAKAFGGKGYKKGKMAPAQDKVFLDWLKSNVPDTGMGSWLPYLEAYNKGWHACHQVESDKIIKRDHPELWADLQKARKGSRGSKGNPAVAGIKNYKGHRMSYSTSGGKRHYRVSGPSVNRTFSRSHRPTDLDWDRARGLVDAKSNPAKQSKNNPTLRAKAKRAWAKVKGAWDSGYEPEWTGQMPHVFTGDLPYAQYRGTSSYDVKVGGKQKLPWGPAFQRIKKAFGDPSIDRVAGKYDLYEIKEEGHTFYDLDTWANYYYLKWNDGMVAVLAYRFDEGSEPTTLNGQWYILAQSQDDSYDARSRIAKALRDKAPKKKKPAQKKTPATKKKKALLKKKKGATKKAKGSAKKGKKPLKRKTRKNCK